MFTLGVGLLAAVALGAPAPKGAKQADAPAAQTAAPGDYVGGDTFATCHDEVAKKFEGNPHTKLAAQHGAAGVNCEGCHGPGKAHVDGGGDKTKIFNPAHASAKEVDETCLRCHSGRTSGLCTIAAREGQCELHQLPRYSPQ